MNRRIGQHAPIAAPIGHSVEWNLPDLAEVQNRGCPTPTLQRSAGDIRKMGVVGFLFGVGEDDMSVHGCHPL